MMGQSRKVDFFLVGASKSATTWLHACCSRHPGICTSRPKQTNYFLDRNEVPFLKHFPEENYYERPLGWYHTRFSHAKPGQMLGDFSPIYFVHPAVAQRIHDYNPDAKILILLRHPVDRLVALHAQILKLFPFPNDLDTALKEYPEFREEGLHCEKIKPYFDLFDSSQVFVRIYDDIRHDALAVLNALFEFLEVDSHIAPEINSAKTNVRSVTRSRALIRMNYMALKALHSNSLMLRVKDILTTLKIGSLYEKVININLRPDSSAGEDIEPELRQSLLDYYRDDIEKTAQVINRNLSSWLQPYDP